MKTSLLSSLFLFLFLFLASPGTRANEAADDLSKSVEKSGEEMPVTQRQGPVTPAPDLESEAALLMIRITDLEGFGLPGVTVRLTADGAEEIFFTDDLGICPCPVLSSGRYDVVAKLAGFCELAVKGVRVPAQQVTHTRFMMPLPSQVRNRERLEGTWQGERGAVYPEVSAECRKKAADLIANQLPEIPIEESVAKLESLAEKFESSLVWHEPAVLTRDGAMLVVRCYLDEDSDAGINLVALRDGKGQLLEQVRLIDGRAVFYPGAEVRAAVRQITLELSRGRAATVEEVSLAPGMFYSIEVEEDADEESEAVSWREWMDYEEIRVIPLWKSLVQASAAAQDHPMGSGQ